MSSQVGRLVASFLVVCPLLAHAGAGGPISKNGGGGAISKNGGGGAISRNGGGGAIVRNGGGGSIVRNGGGGSISRNGLSGIADTYAFTQDTEKELLQDMDFNGSHFWMWDVSPLFRNASVHERFAAEGLAAFRNYADISELLENPIVWDQVAHIILVCGDPGRTYVVTNITTGAEAEAVGGLGLCTSWLHGGGLMTEVEARTMTASLFSLTNDLANVLVSVRTPGTVTQNPWEKYLSEGAPLATTRGTKQPSPSAQPCSVTRGSYANCGFDPSAFARVLRVSARTTLTATLGAVGKGASVRVCLGTNVCDYGSAEFIWELPAATAAGSKKISTPLDPGVYTIVTTYGSSLKLASSTSISFAEDSILMLLEGVFFDDSKYGNFANKNAPRWLDVTPPSQSDCQAYYQSSRASMSDLAGIYFRDSQGSSCLPRVDAAERGLSMALSSAYGFTKQQFYTDRICAASLSKGDECLGFLDAGTAESSCYFSGPVSGALSFPYSTTCFSSQTGQLRPGVAVFVSDYCDNVRSGTGVVEGRASVTTQPTYCSLFPRERPKLGKQ